MTRRVAGMTEAQSRAWLELVTVTELLPAALDAQLRRDAGMTHFEFVVLSILRLSGEPVMRTTRIAQAANATLARLSHVLSRLEARGLVEREPSPADRRATDVRLTNEGRRELVRATPGHIATATGLALAGFDDAELDELARLLGRIAARLDPDDRLGRVIRDDG